MKIMLRDFLNLFFPRYCLACRGPVAHGAHLLCASCAVDLPRTGYHQEPENPVARKFYGLLPLTHAFGYLHFAKGGKVQSLLHQLKYENRPEVGEVLGRWYASELKEDDFGEAFDLIVPIPLHPSKLRKRGYNQSDAIARGLSEGLNIPWSAEVLKRTRHTNTQTRMSRAERYDNMASVFAIAQPEKVIGQRILLVDDVVTTGATLQACGEAIMASQPQTLSIAALAVAQ
ncbi:MAG TPA: competence protein [Cytophagales bacterium]|nr:competence protein [Cytophagales bacterium]HAP59245.1 competence protein [Cytophagales bacterium]